MATIFNEIFKNYPLNIDYRTIERLAPNQSDFLEVLNQDWLLKQFSNGLYNWHWMQENDGREIDPNLKTQEKRFSLVRYLNSRVLPAIVNAYDFILERPLDNILHFREEHYLTSPNTIWSVDQVMDLTKPSTLIPELSKTLDPLKIPVAELSIPREDCTDYELAIYCERRAILTIIDLCLITKPENALECHKRLLADIFSRGKFEQALKIEPLLIYTRLGKCFMSLNAIQNNFPTAIRPVADSFDRGQQPTLPTLKILPFIRLIMIARATLKNFDRREFLIPRLRKAYLDTYYQGNRDNERHLPSDQTLGNWIRTIWGQY